MFNYHQHNEQLSEAERERLLRDGASIRGMVLHSELSAADRGKSLVRVEVSFKGGQTVQFGQELDNLYQPAPGSQEAQRLAEVRGAEPLRHPDRIPKIQQRALHDYIEREQKPKGQPAARKAVVAGPPWAVPAHCPNCGAPVDQAKASLDPDPLCPFCVQPIPVTVP